MYQRERSASLWGFKSWHGGVSPHVWRGFCGLEKVWATSLSSSDAWLPSSANTSLLVGWRIWGPIFTNVSAGKHKKDKNNACEIQTHQLYDIMPWCLCMFVVVIIIVVIVLVIIIELMTNNNTNNSSSSKPAPNMLYNRIVQAYYLRYYCGTFPLVYFKLMSVLLMLHQFPPLCLNKLTRFFGC